MVWYIESNPLEWFVTKDDGTISETFRSFVGDLSTLSSHSTYLGLFICTDRRDNDWTLGPVQYVTEYAGVRSLTTLLLSFH
jgi:hypothetical protein